VQQTSLPKIRLHDLRHTFATLALGAGVPVKVVTEMLGHASVTITYTPTLT
jgi:integrase